MNQVELFLTKNNYSGNEILFDPSENDAKTARNWAERAVAGQLRDEYLFEDLIDITRDVKNGILNISDSGTVVSRSNFKRELTELLEKIDANDEIDEDVAGSILYCSQQTRDDDPNDIGLCDHLVPDHLF